MVESKGIHLSFCCMYGMLDSEERPQGHPQEVIKRLGITYQHATPQSISDQWWFWNCENIPKELPPYLTIKDLDPMNNVGNGLRQIDAERIRDNKKLRTIIIKISKFNDLNSLNDDFIKINKLEQSETYLLLIFSGNNVSKGEFTFYNGGFVLNGRLFKSC